MSNFSETLATNEAWAKALDGIWALITLTSGGTCASFISDEAFGEIGFYRPGSAGWITRSRRGIKGIIPLTESVGRLARMELAECYTGRLPSLEEALSQLEAAGVRIPKSE